MTQCGGRESGAGRRPHRTASISPIVAAQRRRARRSQRRMGWRGMVGLFLVALLLSGLSGAFAYFLPVAVAAYAQTGQTVKVDSGPTPNAGTAATASQAPFTILLLGSD